VRNCLEVINALRARELLKIPSTSSFEGVVEIKCEFFGIAACGYIHMVTVSSGDDTGFLNV